MKRLALLSAIVFAVGCEKTEIHLPPTANAAAQTQNTTGGTVDSIVCCPSQQGATEEFEGMVELFGHSLKARRQVKLNSSGDFVKHGYAVAWFESGQKAGEMLFRDDVPHGKQFIWHENGKKKVHGEWQNGLACGTWTEWHDNGQKKSEGQYINGDKAGNWKYWEEDGRAAGAMANQPNWNFNR